MLKYIQCSKIVFLIIYSETSQMYGLYCSKMQYMSYKNRKTIYNRLMSLRIKEGVKIKGSVNVKIMYYVLLSN
jgi:hypothetical protein